MADERPIVAFTGVEMSAESGIPPYKRATPFGQWYSPVHFGVPSIWRDDPMFAEIWFEDRLRRARKARPHAGHIALNKFARAYASFTLLTETVDGLHQRAGSHAVRELKGSLHERRCECCRAVAPMTPDDRHHAVGCPLCGGPTRPSVWLFGESLPAPLWDEACRAAAAAAVLLIIGKSSAEFPASALAKRTIAAGGHVIEIHPGPDALPLPSLAHTSMPEPSAIVLPELLSAVLGVPRIGDRADDHLG